MAVNPAYEKDNPDEKRTTSPMATEDYVVTMFECGEENPASNGNRVGNQARPRSRMFKKKKLRRSLHSFSAAQDFQNEQKYIQKNFKQRISSQEAKDAPDSIPEFQETQVFGRINFQVGARTSYTPPYIRVDHTDSKDNLLTLLLDHWQLPEPKLVVSIVGGAKRFQFEKSRASTLLKEGLLGLATTTGAWILTPGFNTGVYEMIGSAVKDHLDATGSMSMDNIVLLGIAAWESVAEKHRLVGASENGCFLAEYPKHEILGLTSSRPNLKKGTHVLDPNHSHFLLIDGGPENAFDEENSWRAEFESFLTSHVLSGTEEDDEVHIPMVTLLVNGGKESLKRCAEKLRDKTPLVAVGGSGDAAEVVAQINTLSENEDKFWSNEELQKVYQKAMGEKCPEDCLEALKVIAKNHKYVSVFELQRLATGSADSGLDMAILTALYHPDDLDISKMKAQMRLALAWGRIDYARNELFNISSELYHSFMEEKGFLEEVALDALLKNLPEFVELFIEQGLNLSALVTRKNLEILYKKGMEEKWRNSAVVDSIFNLPKVNGKAGCCSSTNGHLEPDYMHRVGELFRYILGNAYPNIYREDQTGVCINAELVNGRLQFNDPAQHLFLWAILFNKLDLAKILWRISNDHVAGAVVGAGLLKGMSRESDQQEEKDVSTAYLESAEEFEKLAIKILNNCWARDEHYTSDMLVREAPNWGHTTIVSMAYYGGMREFMAQPACHNKLKDIWRGDIALKTHALKIFLVAFLPFLVPILTFERKKDVEELHTDKPRSIFPLNNATNKQVSKGSTLLNVTLFGLGEHEISYPKALYKLFCSPLVKGVHYAVCLLAFLVAFAFFMVSELRPVTSWDTANFTNFTNNKSMCFVQPTCCIAGNVSCYEIITYAYALHSLIDKLRQIIKRNRSHRITAWWREVWLIQDVLAFLFLIVSIILRFTLDEQYFDWARWLYSFSFVLFFLRFMEVFYAVDWLGPNFTIMMKMMVELGFLIVILIVIIVIFGVVTHTIIFPDSPLDDVLIRNIVYKPYYQIYGELFLEDYQEGFTSVLLGFYLILTNILLLNLLIAMFSYKFSKVQEKSEVLWKYNYYEAVFEHFDRPYFPIIGVLLQSCIDSDCKKPSRQSSEFMIHLDSERNSRITKFVRVCTERYIAEEKRDNDDVAAANGATATETLNLLLEQFGDLREEIRSKLP